MPLNAPRTTAPRARLAVLLWLLLAGTATADPATDQLLDTIIRSAGPVRLRATWYRPRSIRPGATAPVAIVLAGKALPAGPESPWVRRLWQANVCTVILRLSSPDATDADWSRIRPGQVAEKASVPPKAVPADTRRFILVADGATAKLALGVARTYPERVAGVVFLGVSPTETRNGKAGLWSLTAGDWTPAFWAVVGTDPVESAETLSQWRRLACRAPADASLTIDTRLDAGRGEIQPDPEIAAWLSSLAAGKRPSPGPDRQARAEQKRWTPTARAIARQVQTPTSMPAGQRVEKREGPFLLRSAVPPAWRRDESQERAYDPRGSDSGPQPYAELCFTPKGAGEAVLRVCAGLWRGGAGDLLDDYRRYMVNKGYTAIPLAAWKHGEWTCRAWSVLLPWKGTWYRWTCLAAAQDGSPDEPTAPLVVLLDPSEKPDPRALGTMLGGLLPTVEVRRVK